MEKPSFVERDISWLSFNHRVLQEVTDPSVPLYERIKFMAIYASNLNEFYRVRVSSMRQFKLLKKDERPDNELKPKKVLKQVRQIVNQQQSLFGKTFREKIIPQLKKENIHIITERSLDKKHAAFAKNYFKKEIREHIEANILSEKNIVFLENHKLYLVVQFDKQFEEIGLVKIPKEACPRFVMVEEGKNFVICFIDDIIRNNLSELFPGQNVIDAFSIKLSRDAELYLGDEYSGDLLEKLKKSIEKRSSGIPTRFLYDQAMPNGLLQKIKLIFGLTKHDVTKGGKYHNFNDFFTFPIPEGKEHLLNEPMPPLPHPVFEKASSLMEVIEEKDQILHFPYQSYKYIPELIREAADDAEVKKFYITLYRVAAKSEVNQSLLYAISKGKQVTVFIEAKARFDEESNLYWGEQLKEAGARVFYSYPAIKVHTKLLLIIKGKGEKERYYTYLGTGNFNENTAKLYCDHAILTANQKIGYDVKLVFDLLTKKIIIPKTKELFVSPFSTRQRFVKLIDNEIKNARAGKQAYMILKMNSLEDPEMITKLYEANNAGVKIKMIVRGICCMLTGIKGMSENIQVVSIVDRFLEHSRVYIFGNNGKEKMYLASADWMTRNLDRRIEVVFPVLDPDCYKELRDIIDIQLSDTIKARRIDQTQSNPYKKPRGRQKPLRSQTAIYQFLKEKSP